MGLVAELLPEAYAQTFPTSVILWDKIVSIEPLPPERVYDIEVEGTHNFIGNGIFAHNTAIFPVTPPEQIPPAAGTVVSAAPVSADNIPAEGKVVLTLAQSQEIVELRQVVENLQGIIAKYAEDPDGAVRAIMNFRATLRLNNDNPAYRIFKADWKFTHQVSPNILNNIMLFSTCLQEYEQDRNNTFALKILRVELPKVQSFLQRMLVILGAVEKLPRAQEAGFIIPVSTQRHMPDESLAQILDLDALILAIKPPFGIGASQASAAAPAPGASFADVTLQKADKRLKVPGAILERVAGVTRLARSLNVELHSKLLVKDGEVVGVISPENEDQLVLISPHSRDEFVVTETADYWQTSGFVLRQLKYLYAQRIEARSKADTDSDGLLTKDIALYLTALSKQLEIVDIGVWSVANNQRYQLTAEHLSVSNLDVLMADLTHSGYAACTWICPYNLKLKQPVIEEGVDVITVHNHPNGNPAPPSAISEEDHLGDIYGSGFFHGEVSAIILDTTEGEEIFFFYEKDETNKKRYIGLYNLYWYKGGNPDVSREPAAIWDPQARTYGRSCNEAQVMAGLRALALGTVKLSAAQPSTSVQSGPQGEKISDKAGLPVGPVAQPVPDTGASAAAPTSEQLDTSGRKLESGSQYRTMRSQTGNSDIVASSDEAKAATVSSLLAKTARQHGIFYSRLIAVFLSDRTDAEKQQEIDGLFAQLPPHFRRLYRKAATQCLDEIRRNRELVERHSGHEIEYLFQCVLRSQNKNEAEIAEVLSEARLATYREAYGIPIIEAESDYYNGLLTSAGIVPAGAGAVALLSDSHNEPSFLIVRTGRLSGTASELDKRHELNHLIRLFLGRAGFLRGISEITPERAAAFLHFRDELISYILEQRDFKEIDAYALAYSHDPQIITLVSQERDFVGICMNIAQKRGIPASDFIYASVRSRNFSELIENILALVPLSEKKDMVFLEIILDNRFGSNTVEIAKTIMTRRNVRIAQEDLVEFVLRDANRSNFSETAALKRYVANIVPFVEAAFGVKLDTDRLLFQAARGRIPFHEESLTHLLAIPSEVKVRVPLTVKAPQEFVQAFFSYWSIAEDAVRTTYEQILKDCPDIRAAFAGEREKIITKGETDYRREMSGGRLNPKVEAEIVNRNSLMKALGQENGLGNSVTVASSAAMGTIEPVVGMGAVPAAPPAVATVAVAGEVAVTGSEIAQGARLNLRDETPPAAGASPLGGIDFTRSMPIVTQPRPLTQTPPSSLRYTVHGKRYTQSAINLQKELQQIERMLAGGIIPSSQRIKEYLISSCASNDAQDQADKILSCIADILRLEEERCCNTDAALRQMLVLLESDKPTQEMQAELAKI